MDSRSEVIEEVRPETPTEEALAVAAEKIVAAVASQEMRVSHSIASVLRAYHFMLERTKKWYSPEEAACVVALASESHGLVTWMDGTRVVGMGTMWPTANPNVSRSRQLPQLERDGQYLYIDWCFGVGDWTQWRRMISHGALVYAKAGFVCCHDGRATRRGNKARGSGRLIVRKIHRPAVGFDRLLRATNG